MVLFWLALLLTAGNPVLTGRVLDRSHKPLAHAEVRIITPEGETTDQTTDDRGSFRFDVSGRFRLEIRHEGFRSIQSNLVSLPREGLYEIDVILLPGESTVTDAVDLQIQEQQSLEQRADPTASDTLPKSDRLFGLRGGVNLYGIKEGSAQQWLATLGNVFTSSSISAGPLSIVEFRPDHGGFSPVEESLPAGEDAFHGNIHYFHRNDVFNARNFFDLPDQPIPPFKYNFFGGDLGGRLRENTHFYGQYWGLRIQQSITQATLVPEPQWLRGDFSNLLPAVQLVDPDTGFPFIFNQITKDRFSKSGLAIAAFYPAPNVKVQRAGDPNYRAVAELNTAADSFALRLDHRIGVSDEAFFQYQFDRDTTEDPFNLISGITNLPFFGVHDALQTHSFRISNAHVFSPTFIQQTRFSFSHLWQPRNILSSSPQPSVLITGFSNIGHASNLPQERRSDTYEFVDSLEWQRKTSSTRVGAELRYFPFHGFVDMYSRGQFQFTNALSGNSIANLLLGYPSNALRIQGNTTRDFQTWVSSFYLQHNVRLRPHLSISAGIRYDYQTPYVEAHNLVANFDPVTATVETAPKSLYKPDRQNWGPRVGVAWQPPVKDVVVRGDYGIFYDTLQVGDSLFLLGLNPPFVRFDLGNNGLNVESFNLDNAFDSPDPSTPPSLFSTSRELANPYVQQWNLSVERFLPGDFTLEAGYYGQKGTRLRRQVNLNEPTPAGAADTIDDRRPYPSFRNIFQFETTASSVAHAADVRMSRRVGGRFSMDAAYRFARSIDDATLISILPQDSHNLRAERGLSDFHIKHRLTFQLSANLPGRSILHGWQFHGIGVLQSGFPLSAVQDTDAAGTGYPIVNRPNLLHDPNISDPTPNRFFDTSAFQMLPAGSGQFGNSGRNVIIGPGLWNLDTALSRSFRMSDVTRLQFRADAYNVLNHPNFIAPPSIQNFAGSQGFGELSVARSPRILQFGLKFLW
jgi:hypothetical protein